MSTRRQNQAQQRESPAVAKQRGQNYELAQAYFLASFVCDLLQHRRDPAPLSERMLELCKEGAVYEHLVHPGVGMDTADATLASALVGQETWLRATLVVFAWTNTVSCRRPMFFCLMRSTLLGWHSRAIGWQTFLAIWKSGITRWLG